MTTSDHGKEAASKEPDDGRTSETASENGEVQSESVDIVRVSESSGAVEATEEEIEDRAYKVGFGVAKSLRYHAKRRRWFDNWHSAGQAAAVFSATAAFASVAGAYPDVSRWIALVFAALTAVDLIVGFNRRAEVHARLYGRFSELAGDIGSVANPIDPDVRRWEVERLRIEADEPPSIDTLNVLCHNHEVEARGLGAEYYYHLNWWDRLFANLFSLRSTYLPAPPRG